jgi:hypothetical protein
MDRISTDNLVEFTEWCRWQDDGGNGPDPQLMASVQLDNDRIRFSKAWSTETETMSVG